MFNSLTMLCIKESEESLFKLIYLYLLFNANLFLIKENHCSTETKYGEKGLRNITFRFNLDKINCMEFSIYTSKLSLSTSIWMCKN